MLEIITQTSEKLGISEDAVKQLSGAVMKLFRDNADPEEFEQLRDKVPDTDEVIAAAPEEEEGAGLLMGGGGTVGLMSLFHKLGLSGEQSGAFLTLFTKYLKGKAGTELVHKVVSRVPGLGKFLG